MMVSSDWSSLAELFCIDKSGPCQYMWRELVGLVTVEWYTRLTVLWNGAAGWDSSSHMLVIVNIIAMSRDK